MYALINVRLGSTRLPEKIFKVFDNGDIVLDALINRILQSRHITEVIINTTERLIDDRICDFAVSRSLKYNRGPEDDVLGRMKLALEKFPCDYFVEVYGDCPLIDPEIIDFNNNKDLDFVGNDLKTTFPPGFECEVIRSSALLDSECRCADPIIREHGSLFVRLSPNLYNIHNFECTYVFNVIPHLTLDTPEDFVLINKVHSHCVESHGPKFTLRDVITYLEKNPSLLNLNKNIERKWKQYRLE